MLTSKKIGVLGGGQLGRMLIQDAISLDIQIHCIDPDAEAPCKFIAHHFQQGSLTNFGAVYAFGKTVDLLTIEIEHVNVDALEQLEAEGLPVFPQPRLLRLIQDKGLQKLFYQEHGIPTADFVLVDNLEQVKAHTNRFPAMQKMRKGGYDGKGVTKLTSADSLGKAFDAPSVLESLVDFEKELSVIVARSVNGEVKTFPAVEMEFNAEANLVEFLFSPAAISPAIEAEAQRVASLVADKLGIVGLLAVELFLTRDGKILVNEVAPRPHNSGHQSIEGNYTSQYEQHLRSILGLPLGSTAIVEPSIMVNVLGEKGFEGPVIYEGIETVLAMEGVYVHLYGKKLTKPFRKMGHVTVLAKTMEAAREKALRVNTILKVKA
jgi:5-(carboxyamino)imidazole ribonucleotide synthase